MASNWRVGGDAARLPRRQPDRRHLRHRHARADAAAAVGRRDARRHRHRRRARRRRARRARARRFRRWKGRIWCGASPPTHAFDWPQEDPDEFGVAPDRLPKRRLKIAAYDFGMKWNILRRLSAHGCDVRVFPATTPASELLATRPGRRVPEQRPRRSGAARPTRSTTRKTLVDVERAGVRHLPRPPDSRPGDGRQHLQAEVRPPRRESSGEEARDRQDRDHVAESRLRRRSGSRCRPTSR